VNNDYRKILENHYVWDYSTVNYHLIAHQNKALINFFYDQDLCRIPINDHKEWDLIFYGSINDRRKKILDSLTAKGLKIKSVFGLYGPERDRLIGQSRAVLNLHYYDSQILQQIRIFYPLINKIPVISENFPEKSAPESYSSFLFTPEQADMKFEDFVVELLENKTKFDQIAAEKLSQFELTKKDSSFEAAVQAATIYFGGLIKTSSEAIPFKKINLGSGKDYRYGYLNIDLREEVFPDILYDLSQSTTFPILCNSNLLGNIKLDENQIDEIIANDVLEHVPNLESLMGNCLALLKIGGVFKINVPYDLSYGAWQDPTHIRAFNQKSWLYYTDWHWYLGWVNHKFDMTELKFSPSELGFELMKKNINHEEILRTPRAIDSMQVTLVKRETTPEEKTNASSYSNSLKFY
jgi:SAM-dependent methyltransferase